MKIHTIACMSALAFLPAAARAADIEVPDAYAYPSVAKMAMGAAFLTLKNTSGKECIFQGAKSDVTETIELHDTVQNGDVMQMKHLASVTLPAGETVEFVPGARHLMLMGLKKPLKEADRFMVLLDFGACGTLEKPFIVKLRP